MVYTGNEKIRKVFLKKVVGTYEGRLFFTKILIKNKTLHKKNLQIVTELKQNILEFKI